MTTPAVEPRIAPLEAKRARRAFYGPAFVAAVAYVDPGNFATNFQAGAKFGYLLVWVLVAANLVAVFVQYLSAKIGLAAGRTCRPCAAAPSPAP